MRRVEPEHKPVEKAPPRAGPLDKQAVHLRRQPQDAKALRERRLIAGGITIDADDATFAAIGLTPGADADRSLAGRDGRGDSPAGTAGFDRRGPPDDLA